MPQPQLTALEQMFRELPSKDRVYLLHRHLTPTMRTLLTRPASAEITLIVEFQRLAAGITPEDFSDFIQNQANRLASPVTERVEKMLSGEIEPKWRVSLKHKIICAIYLNPDDNFSQKELRDTLTNHHIDIGNFQLALGQLLEDQVIEKTAPTDDGSGPMKLTAEGRFNLVRRFLVAPFREQNQAER